MTRLRRSSGRFAQGRSSRLTQWISGPGGDDLAGLDSITVTTSSIAIIGLGVSTGIMNTIVRVHGFVELTLTAAASQLDGFGIALGMCLVPTDGFVDIGSTAMPDPFDDIGWPGWMWHYMDSMRTAHGQEAVDDLPNNPRIVRIDAKAMRKWGTDQTLCLIGQFGEAGVSSLSVKAATRVLIKNP